MNFMDSRSTTREFILKNTKYIPHFDRMKGKEKEVLILKMSGFQIKEIASHLNLTTNSIKCYLKKIYMKLEDNMYPKEKKRIFNRNIIILLSAKFYRNVLHNIPNTFF